jgi:1-acyl-sn-glycerol-3-phosphate acyltransferase
LISFFYNFFKTIFYIFFKVFHRLKVIGSENVPIKGGAIIAANHASYLDPPAVGVALKRRAVYMAREGLFRIPLLGLFIRTFSLPVRRGKPLPSTIKEVVRRLKHGEVVVIFPEGGRSTDGSIADIKRGIGVITQLAKVPVIPAYLSGTGKALPVGAKFLRLAKITVIFGHPLKIDKKEGENEKQFQERIGKSITEAIKHLRGEMEPLREQKITNHDQKM